MIEQFVKQLLQEKNLPENLDEEVYNKLVSDLTTRVEDLINRRIIESLNEEQLGHFEHLIDTEPENTEAVQKFIEENVKNREEITTAALMEFRELYLGNG
jgi:DNA replication protein DnaD